jgi:hypothetical protein
MEYLHQPYESIMSIPAARRRRFCEEKENIEKVREAKRKQQGR